MRVELTKRFAKKMIIKIVVFVICMIVITAVGQSVSPIISNNLALGQMQNSDEMFVLMNTYNNIHHVIHIAYTCVVLGFIGVVGRDTYKFVTTINTENNKEI